MHIFFGSYSNLNWCTFIVKTPTIVLKSLKKLEEHAKSAMVSQKIIFKNCIFFGESIAPRYYKHIGENPVLISQADPKL